MDYFQYFESIHQCIHDRLNVFIYGDYEENWNEKFINWLYNLNISMTHGIEWEIISFSFVAIAFIAFIYIIAVNFASNTHIISMDQILRNGASSINNNSQMSLESGEYICEPLEICEIIEDNSIFEPASKKYNQFYVVSLGINQPDNSSMQINEIYDSTDDSDNCESKIIVDTKNIVDELINSVDAKLDNSEASSAKLGSKIPLLRTRGNIDKVIKK